VADAEVAAYTGRWRPSPVPPRAAGKLAGYAIGLGLDAVPEVVVHPSAAGRFTRCAPGLPGVARRTLRTNLRFTGRRVVPQFYPRDLPLPRERARAPYGPAQIAGYLALADAQPAMERRMRAAALACLGAGAGLIRPDLREVRGSDVACRSGGVIVTVGGLRGEHADLRRGRSGPPEHHQPADHQPGRRKRATPAGHQPAAGNLAAGLRAAAGAGHIHARGRDQLLPAARRPDHRAGTGWRGRCSPAARGGTLVMIPLPALEEVTGRPQVAARIEMLLPTGVRPRQLTARTLLAGLCLTQAGGRPAHLTRVHDLLEASIPEEFKNASTSLAVDWTDLETFSRPPPSRGGDCAGPEASWGHRKNNLLRTQDELFYGYYLSAGIMMPGENSPAVPESARRAALSSCRHDPVRVFAPVLTAMRGQGIPPGDIPGDSGYARRDASAWAIPLRTAGAQLVQDLHPHDRGPKGTHDGAVISNGSLYCPQTPRPLPEPGPLARTATTEQAADWERETAELARYKPGRLTSDDQDGYHRVQCPAAMGKIRCPLRPASMTLDRDRPQILQPPEHPQACCTQQTITVPPAVLARTAQKHDYPSAAWRRSYRRRTGAERGFATAKDPATSDISRG
jgi:hypothetical protein